MGGQSERFKDCSICASIPEKSGEMWISNERSGETHLPNSENKLEIIGAPYYNDDLTNSKTLLKRCPECGTYYEWKVEYTYLVTGSEDDIQLTRLNDTEGERRAVEIAATLQQLAEAFQAKLPAAIEVLADAESYDALKRAVDFLSYAQRVEYQDIADAIPALLLALSRYAGMVNAIKVMSYDLVRQPESAALILNTIKESDEIKTFWPEIVSIVEECEKTVQGVGRQP